MKRFKLERTPYSPRFSSPSSSSSTCSSSSSNSMVYLSLSSTLLLLLLSLLFVFLPSGINGELSSITVNSATSSQPFQPISTPFKSFITLNKTKDGYYLTARVGTPGLTVRLVLDTSSITYLVSATTCPSKTSGTPLLPSSFFFFSFSSTPFFPLSHSFDLSFLLSFSLSLTLSLLPLSYSSLLRHEEIPDIRSV
jgi:hypothetical protein